VALPAVAFAADQIIADGDTVLAGDQASRNLGNVAPGATVTPNVNFSLDCNGTNHFNSNETADINFTSSTAPTALGGSATATSLSNITGPASWPADGGSGNDCNTFANASLGSSTVTIVAPKKAGTYTYTVNYALNRDAGTDNNELAGIQNAPVTFTLTVDNAAPVINTFSGVTEATEGEHQIYFIQASDANEDTLSYNLTKASGTANVSITQIPSPPGGPGHFDVEFLTPGTVVLQASASDGTATVTQDKTVTVNPACTAPSVTQQPQNTTATFGDNTATFTAAANGTAPVGVQWEKSTDGGNTWNPVSGATNATLTVNNPSVSDSGTKYRAVFTNGCGSATSDAATLTVNRANTTISDVSGSGTFGENATLTATLKSGTEALSGKSVEFKLDGQVVGNANTDANGVAELTGVSLAGKDAGTYANAVEASFAQETNYNASTGSGPLTVNKAAGSVSINNIPTTAVLNGSFTPTYTKAGDGATSVNSLTSATCTVSGGVVSFVGAGTCTLQAKVAEGTNHLAATGAQQPFNVGYKFVGFSTPVDNNNVLNTVKAGQAIPLKWQLLDANNVPVTNLSSVKVTAVSLACPLGATADLIEEVAAGASGLQNLGGGYYQFNWKTPTNYAKSCKTMQLDLGEGQPRTALFQFTR
jgi:hypothetical protein